MMRLSENRDGFQKIATGKEKYSDFEVYLESCRCKVELASGILSKAVEVSGLQSTATLHKVLLERTTAERIMHLCKQTGNQNNLYLFP